MFALPDAAQTFPLAGTGVMFGFVLKIVWSARADWASERATMKKEWAEEKAALIAYNDSSLVRMQENCALTTDTLRRLHVEELASLNRRIDALGLEVKELRGRK